MSTISTTAEDLLLNIRDDIPDPVADANDDGDFSKDTLCRWINNSMDEIASRIPCVYDWSGIQSQQNMDVYELDPQFLSIEQLWYDTWPCWRAPELDALFVSKVSGRSFFFGPHSVGAFPRLHVWPCADRSGSTTTLATGVNATATTFTLTSTSGFQAYGYFLIDNEIVLYRTVNAPQLTNILRGQAGTTKASHSIGAPITELNIMFKYSRLANHISAKTDTIEIPPALHPLVEMGVLASVRSSEQEFQEAKALRQEFKQGIKEAIDSLAMNKIKQGMQVRVEPPSPFLYWGRVFVP